jgi:hypothetical protein
MTNHLTSTQKDIFNLIKSDKRRSLKSTSFYEMLSAFDPSDALIAREAFKEYWKEKSFSQSYSDMLTIAKEVVESGKYMRCKWGIFAWAWHLDISYQAMKDAVKTFKYIPILNGYSESNGIITHDLVHRTAFETNSTVSVLLPKHSNPVEEALLALADIKINNQLSIKEIDSNHGLISNKRFMVEVNIPDFHLDDLNGQSIDERKKQFLSVVDELIQTISYRGIQIDELVFPIGNDFFSSDGATRATTKGTPQQLSTDFKDAFVTGYACLVEAIERFKGLCDNIQVICIPGNHAKATEFYLGMTLQAYFKGDKKVNVVVNYDPTSPYIYGNTLIVYQHGEIKPNKVLPLIQSLYRKEIGMTKWTEVHCGHIHMEKMVEVSTTKIRYLPSLVASNSWHKEEGYNHLRCAQVLYYEYEKGFEGLNEVRI